MVKADEMEQMIQKDFSQSNQIIKSINRYMVDKGKYKGVVDCIVQLVQKNGFKGFLKGFFPFFLWL